MKNKLLSLINNAKNNIKNNKIPFIIFIVIWIALIVITLSTYKTSLGMESSGNDNFVGHETDVLEIDKNTEIKQVVKLEDDVQSISLRFATFARKNKGDLFINVKGRTSGFIYLDEKVNVKDIQDNAYKTFGLIKNDSNKDEYVDITITSNCESDSCVGIYFSREKAFLGSLLSINNKEANGDLKLRFLSSSQVLRNFSNSVIIWTIIGFTIVLLLWVSTNRYEVIFATTVFVLGLIFMIIITPMSPPDEQKHYEYSFQLSNYVFGEGNNHIEMDSEYQNYTDFEGHMNTSRAYKGFVEDINKPLYLSNVRVKMNDDILESSYYLCYIPQTIGISIARLFKLNMLRTFYSGRLFNLLFYCLCVYIAIKKTSAHKLLFGVIASMPILIQQAASYSYDTFLNGLMLIIAAFFFNWKFEDKNINNKEIIELLIITMFVSPLKVIYGMFVIAFWFIPYTKFGTRKKKILSLSIICVPILIRLIIMLTPSIINLFRFKVPKVNISQDISISSIATAVNENDVSVVNVVIENPYYGQEYSVWYATNHVLETIGLFYQTIRYNIKIWFYESIGRVLSGESLLLPLTISHLLSGVVIAAAIRKENSILSIPIKLYFIFACICVGLLAMAGMMVTWTRVGDKYIQGMQGRYFSPMLFYFLPVLNNKYVSIPKKFDKYIVFVQLMVIFEVIIYVLSFTFVN